MFRSFKKILGVILIISAVCMCSAVSAFAADGLELDSDATFNTGDEFTYTLYLSDSTEPVEGIQMYIYYDKEYLEIDPDSLVFTTLDSAMYNADLDGFFTFNWATPMPEYAIDYTNRTDLVSANFTVLKPGKTDITYFIKQLYGGENQYLKSYKLTYDISKDGNMVSAEKTPVVNPDMDNANENQGYFINYLDGMGEDNSPNKDNHPAIIGQMPTGINGSVYTPSNGSTSSTTIIVVVAVVLVLLAVVAVLIIRKKDDKNKTNNIENLNE